MLRLMTEEVAKLMVLREVKNKTALARRAGLSKQHLSKVLRSQVFSLSTLDRLCVALECQPGDILEKASGAGDAPA